jgi:hypothetical protein
MGKSLESQQFLPGCQKRSDSVSRDQIATLAIGGEPPEASTKLAAIKADNPPVRNSGGVDRAPEPLILSRGELVSTATWLCGDCPDGWLSRAVSELPCQTLKTVIQTTPLPDSQNRRLLPRTASGSSCHLSVDSRFDLPQFYGQLRG